MEQTQNRISDERLEVIHRRVNLYIGDNNATPLLHAFDLKLRRLDADGKAWGIDAEEQLTALRASHKRLAEALESYPAYPNSCMHNEEPDYCDGCRYQYEKAVRVWQKQRSAALADARKLEGE